MVLVAKSQKSLADSIGISERTFATWLTEGCPGEPRSYAVRDVITWAKKHKWVNDIEDRILDSVSDDLKRELIKERISKLQRDNRLADYKIEERDANLVDVGIIKNFLVQFSGRIRNAITVIEKKYGADSCSPIRSALDMMAKDLEGGVLDGGK